MLTDCSSIQGSTTSSSSDVMTLTTSSSWCAIPASSRIRVLRLLRPHMRRLLVTPDGVATYGFAVRGGKEFGTGFFVSNVDRNSEADLKGLRIGDQILRINGFRIDDSVHREFIQFVSSQDRITLKVRGVGMLPIKEKEHDKLSWNVVKTASVSNTPSESSFRSAIERDVRSKNVNVVLNVAPRTKLGLGICKGPEWKPGIFVQFTKEKSVAREAGLRPGDQILSVNSIDFSDVLFSEAVAVMKGSNKLEMLVRTGAGCDLFPGESSGYNSSASSVTGDQSPCWADPKSKRLTAVREEPPPACWNESLYAEHRQNAKPNAEGTRAGAGKEINKTIIKLSENGTSINNTYIANPNIRSMSQQDSLIITNAQISSKTGTMTAPPPPPPTTLHTDLGRGGSFPNASPKSVDNSATSRQRETKTVAVEVHRNATKEGKRQQTMLQRSGSKLQDINGGTFKSSASASASAATMTTAKAINVSKPSAISSCRNNVITTTSNNSNNNSSSHNDVGGSALSSAITEELKKRKEKQRINAATAATNNSQNNCNNKMSNSQHDQQIATLRQQVAKRTPSGRANSSAANCNERCNAGGTGTGGGGGGGGAASGSTAGVGDQHSALMDEFKRAHQRMFKNGFQESDRKERQEALKRTTIMEDDVNHRKSQNCSMESRNSNEKPVNGNEVAQNGQQLHIPPPPPQFANSPPQAYPITSAQQAFHKPFISAATKQPSQKLKAPSSPVPDYDNIQIRSTRSTLLSKATTDHNNTSSNTVTKATEPASAGNRRMMRLGTVTIGEYDLQRKEPTKFDFVSMQKRAGQTNEAQNPESLRTELQHTLTRSNLKKSNGHLEHQSHCPLQNSYENCQFQNGSNVENLTRKLQSAAIANRSTASSGGSGTVTGPGPGVSAGILKNGSRSSSSGFTKNTEKTITFGN